MTAAAVLGITFVCAALIVFLRNKFSSSDSLYAPAQVDDMNHDNNNKEHSLEMQEMGRAGPIAGMYVRVHLSALYSPG